MARYAFIDVPNTSGTTRECLGFSVDWHKLHGVLTNKKWACDNVYFYKGHKGNKEKEQLEKMGEDTGYVIRTKLTHIHPNKTKKIAVVCPDCEEGFIHEEVVNGNWKSNCDVELAVDACNLVKSGDDVLLLTGDGDFAYLVEDLVRKGATVKIVSNTKKDRNKKKRFSTRLQAIIDREENSEERRVTFLNLDNWKLSIQKENRHEA